ncbi:hypothetical protein [Algoriphagus antarcticus]|uniref:Uncharacterized protein n=1 Tax=Algoriphagus antarcticus TaxID=238540 RepID=A0A3E0E7U3_9BACT|nr:hypothetical protein [Algoriphagus antarcticus]REG94307.1 hypothetical protein C8N25_101132 [Algoriphagus antarcticus]
MLNSIQTLSDVETFFIYLIHEESLNFHPDEDFKSYINVETRLPSYSPEEAELRNKLMEACFEICEKEGVEIYDIGLPFLLDRLK